MKKNDFLKYLAFLSIVFGLFIFTSCEKLNIGNNTTNNVNIIDEHTSPTTDSQIKETGLMPYTVDSNEEMKIIYSLNSKGDGYVVTGFTGKPIDVTIPNEYKSLPVTDIGENAFHNCRTLKKITIPDGVKSIGKDAFNNCSSLTSITIPNSVENIAFGAFAYSNSIQYNEYENAYYIGNIDNPYLCLMKSKDKNITSCQINEKCKHIYYGAFYDCSLLKNVTIPDGVISIGQSVFSGCPIEKATIPAIACSDVCNPNLKEVVITSGEAIEDYAFQGCSSLTNVIIPDSVTSIGVWSFVHCTTLADIVIHDGVTSIGDYAFMGCSSLANVIIPDSVTSIGDGVFYGCPIEKATIPTIACSDVGNPDLKEVVITSGETIEDYAFGGCNSLTSIVIPNGVTSIGNSTFYNCSSLTSIVIPDSVTSIGDDAFHGCYSLVEIYNLSNLSLKIGSSNYGHISENAKIIHTSLDEKSIITIDENGYEFAYVDNKGYLIGYDGDNNKLVLPESFEYDGATINSYEINQGAFYECDSLSSITISNNITSIGQYAFLGCSSLANVIISDSVTSIGVKSFAYCTTLADIAIHDGVESIGEFAFRECSSLTKIIIPDSVTSIGDSVFYDCSSLTSIIMSESVTNIGYNAFDGCSSLTSIKIPDSVTNIGYNAFYGCSSLSSITIPNSVTCIDSSAFYGCSSLTSIIIPNSVTSIGSSAFYGCSSSSSIIIPNSVISIGENAFDNCTALKYNKYDNANYLGNEGNPYLWLISSIDKNITSCLIKDNCKYIYLRAFENCTSLENITIPNSVTNIGTGVFGGCSSLTNIIIPDSVTNIGESALNGCSSLESLTIPFVGDKEHLSTDSYQYPFGYIFGETIYEGGTLIDQYYYVTSTSRLTMSSYCIPSALKEVIITRSNYVPYGAFYNCSMIKSITISNAVTKIMESAFYGCTSLTSIMIPNSVTSIGQHAFSGCKSLEKIYYTGSFPYSETITSIGFDNEKLTSGTWYYFTTNGANETSGGNWWYYDNDGIIVEIEI